MTPFPTLKYSFAALLAFALAGTAMSRADEFPKKDDALDRLLDKLEQPTTPPEAKAEKPEAVKPGTEPAKTQDKDKDKPKGGVAPKDQALDSLLEKLGETTDRPETQDEKRGGRPMPGDDPADAAGKGDQPMPPRPDQPAPGGLTGKDQTIDERLEEISGKRRKKKDQGDEDSGPLGRVIKEMREVEQRLGKPDTGEETRKKQTEIVKNLEQIIEELKSSSSQSQGKKMRMVRQPGQKPGSQPSQTPGANAGGAPSTKPTKPESKHAFANGKDEWGHLPPELRQEIDNIAREVMLPSKEELIRLYYLSVSKKSLAREE